MEALRKIISNTIFHIISLITSAGAIYGAYYMRYNLQYSFKTLYYLSYIFLILSFLIFLLTYKDENEDTKALVKESISGYFFFIVFFAITLILRGNAS